jgi:predicted PurR-regulated permease PerM
MESKIHSTIIVITSSILAFVLISVAGIPPTTQFENVLAQGEGGAGQQGANQTMQQQEDPEHSANRTMEKAIQSANETGQDVGEVGSQVTEGAKDLIGSIGEKLQDLGK